MYKTIVPIYSHGRRHSKRHLELLVDQLLKTKADMALLTVSRVLRNDATLRDEVESLRCTKEYLEAHKIKVGIWMAPTIGYGGTGAKSPCDNDADEVYTRIKHLNGDTLYAYCPLDEAFVDDFIHTLKAYCGTGIDFILFEDDFTLSGGKSFDIGCACPKHMSMYAKALGYPIDEATLKEALYCGQENEIRDAWYKCTGRTLTDFAAKIEKEIHSEYPNVRIGLSANSASYTLEGVDLPSLAKTISGESKPFVRLTGAPYWKNALSFATNMEAIRLQAVWQGKDVETVSEGDTFPRPRHWIPSKLLEIYDMVLRADGNTDGILKYMFDYTSRIDFETGYAERHCRNQRHYEAIERIFSGKKAVGLRVFENMMQFSKTDFSNGLTAKTLCINSHLPTMSQEICVDNSIPTTYLESDEAAIVFGENAHFVNEEMLNSGVILDASSAIILHNKGIDVGFEKYAPAPPPSVEYFCAEDDYVATGSDNPGSFYDFELDKNADILSEFIVADGVLSTPGSFDGRRYPACYYYENGLGQRFLVYSFVAHTIRVKNGWFRGYFRNYLRQKQLNRSIERLQSHPLPAICEGNPQLYVLCKRDECSMAVGLWNIYPDEVLDPVIVLDKKYESIEFYNCSGRLEENRVVLDRDIAPYDFAFFTVS